MRPILETYLRRLTNLSGKNRSLLIQKLRADHFVDVQRQPKYSIMLNLRP